ncbi:MAG TPA: hypothetical protein PLJ21_12905, partial [Pseudobdellovibrionaceae bacterium]|nr:hypothetical protein [Pseudobdellovibrionaceae bacterium]
MKVQKFFLSLLVLLFSLGSSVSDPECELQGLWVLDRYVYNEIEKKVQYTLMTFNFESPVSTLFWKDREHPEFCERKATFVYNPPLLYQEIIW